jgi:hypothetical protein
LEAAVIRDSEHFLGVLLGFLLGAKPLWLALDVSG